MRQLTPHEREALMADMRSFFEQSPEDEVVRDDDTVDNEGADLDHGLSDVMPKI